MQQFAQKQLLGAPAIGRSSTLRGSSPADGDGGSSAASAAEAAGVRLVSTAMSAMAVVAVTAVPALAAAEHAAALRRAQAERSERPADDEHSSDLVLELLSALVLLWKHPPPLGDLLPSVVEVGHLSRPTRGTQPYTTCLCSFVCHIFSRSQTRHASCDTQPPPTYAVHH